MLNNFKLWVEQGLPTISGPDDANSSDIIRREIDEKDLYPINDINKKRVATYEDVLKIAKDKPSNYQILDARPAGRFTGKDPEPRAGLSSGHIPNSISIPFNTLLDAKTKALLPADELRKILLDAGVSDDPFIEKISSCGTGVTAIIIDLALDVAGFRHPVGKRDVEQPYGRRVYDGSWTEWAQRSTGDLIKKG